MYKQIRIKETTHRPLRIKAAELGITLDQVIKKGVEAINREEANERTN